LESEIIDWTFLGERKNPLVSHLNWKMISSLKIRMVWRERERVTLALALWLGKDIFGRMPEIKRLNKLSSIE